MQLQQPVNLELFLQLPVNIQQLAIATVSLPLVAFAFCVGYSFQYNFDVRSNNVIGLLKAAFVQMPEYLNAQLQLIQKRIFCQGFFEHFPLT